MGNVELLTFVLVKSDGKELIVTLAYHYQVVIMELAKVNLNVIVKMVGTVLTVISLNAGIVNMDVAWPPMNVFALMDGLVEIVLAA